MNAYLSFKTKWFTKKIKYLFLLIFCLFLNCIANAQSGFFQINTFEQISTGYAFTEGPVWSDDSSLFFSDITGNTIYKWKSQIGVVPYLTPSGNSNGIDIDKNGKLIIAQQGSRQISRVESNGTITPLVTHYNGLRLNSPNDIVIKSSGKVYFTDPTYGITPGQQELSFKGVYCYDELHDTLYLLVDTLQMPNGIALSPDESTLYVCDSQRKKVYSYLVRPNGLIQNAAVFATLNTEIDGIKTDVDGNVYVAAAFSGIKVFNKAGVLIDSLTVPEKVTNLNWGDAYGNTLYITAGTSVYRVHCNPDYPFVLRELLGRPENNTVTLSMMAEDDLNIYVEYGTTSGNYTMQTQAAFYPKDIPFCININNLSPNTRYYYRVRYKNSNETIYNQRNQYSFHTKRNPSSTFSFAVHADPHLDESSNYTTYEKALQNTLSQNADFMLDLGDNFMSEKLYNPSNLNIKKRLLLLRHFYEKACHSVPLYLVIGNHEGELGWELDGTANNIAINTTKARKLYYPNPESNSFYNGDTTNYNFIGKRQSYYSWTWGNALFVVLDPYWFTTTKPNEVHDVWQFTLGNEQYQWFKNVLESSNAKFKFVFAHQIVGGDELGRGGFEYLRYYEMGGYNADGTWGFTTKRPGWSKPLHQLMVDNGVNVYFHGHDHMYVKQISDSTGLDSCNIGGLIYQLGPQPSLPNYTNTSSVTTYNYHHGVVIANSGHLKITVSDTISKVEYVRAFHKDNPGQNQINGMISDIYYIYPCNNSTEIKKIEEKNLSLNVFPNPFDKYITIDFENKENCFVSFTILDFMGRVILENKNRYFNKGNQSFKIDLSNINEKNLQPGIYILNVNFGGNYVQKKIIKM